MWTRKIKLGWRTKFQQSCRLRLRLSVMLWSCLHLVAAPFEILLRLCLRCSRSSLKCTHHFSMYHFASSMTTTQGIVTTLMETSNPLKQHFVVKDGQSDIDIIVIDANVQEYRFTPAVCKELNAHNEGQMQELHEKRAALAMSCKSL